MTPGWNGAAELSSQIQPEQVGIYDQGLGWEGDGVGIG